MSNDKGYRRRYYLEHREHIKAATRRNYALRDRAELRIQATAREHGYRAQILAAYGQKCSCCGESNPRFLSIDHVNGGGAQHRKRRGPSSIYREIINAGFPLDYQVLCFNCNAGRHLNGGICPHREAI